VDITELRRNTLPGLQAMAAKLNIANASGLRKQDLIFRIEHALLGADHLLRAEGTLEILVEGYGFLRSPDWSYLAGPDDIYVSPSQIKRFDLRTGDTVAGQVRPPKPGERYLALLKVETINGQEPEKAKGRPTFDTMRPQERRPVDARDGPHRADRQRTARADRRAAARREDDPPPEDGGRDRGESSRGGADRAADRRAPRGSDGLQGAGARGRDRQLDVR
jgi:hypothetical protein